MITDILDNASFYCSLHPLFAGAFEFLRRPDLAALSDGRQEIDGDRLFAIISRDAGRGREAAQLEHHRRYIDIQYVVAGDHDSIGWLPTRDCRRVSSGYDAETDLAFFYDRPNSWIDVAPGSFCVFFPDDAHAPLAMNGNVHKVIVKIAV